MNINDKLLLFDLLAKDYIKALKKGEIQNNQRKYLSSNILKSLENESSWEKIIDFLNTFSKKYKFFYGTGLSYKKEYYRRKEKEIIYRLRRQIKNY